jgi:hypothetical protein
MANRWLMALIIAAAILASSCSRSALPIMPYPDVDPGPDVDYIGEAVSISR